jgi:hypothetical protein
LFTWLAPIFQHSSIPACHSDAINRLLLNKLTNPRKLYNFREV